MGANADMMENLRTILGKLHNLLGELEEILVEEIRQLSRAQVNPVSLQIVSDNKSRLLSAINFYDEQRRQEEKNLLTEAPYPDQPLLSGLWESVYQAVRQSSELNQKSFHLLELHMQKLNAFKKIVAQSGAAPALYGEQGNADHNNAGSTCRISV